MFETGTCPFWLFRVCCKDAVYSVYIFQSVSLNFNVKLSLQNQSPLHKYSKNILRSVLEDLLCYDESFRNINLWLI